MAATAPHYATGTLYGPFHRRRSSTQDGETLKKQLLSGEIWGYAPSWGGAVAAKAYTGPLKDGEEGIEFWTFAKPDRPHGPVASWSNAGEHVRIENEEVAKVEVAITRVSGTMIEALK